MTGKADPFWEVVGGYGVDEVLVLPEWLKVKDRPRPAQPASDTGSSMAKLMEETSGCMLCDLGRTRKNIVFGEGNPGSGILVIGEGPGATEDETGRPFVGRSGQLLDRILAAVDLDRNSLYIANIVKCRPPGNRAPTAVEAEICGRILQRQIDAMDPGVILVLGASAARYILDTGRGIGVLRGEFHRWRDIPVLVTYHPAALLRSPALKRPVWEDMKMFRSFLNAAGLPRVPDGGERLG